MAAPAAAPPPLYTASSWIEFIVQVYDRACQLKAVDWRTNAARWVEYCINARLGAPMFRTLYAGEPLGEECVLGICYGGGRGSGQWFKGVPRDEYEDLRAGRLTYRGILAKYGGGKKVLVEPRRLVDVLPGRVGWNPHPPADEHQLRRYRITLHGLAGGPATYSVVERTTRAKARETYGGRIISITVEPEKVVEFDVREGEVHATEYESFGPVTPEEQKALDERLKTPFPFLDKAVEQMPAEEMRDPTMFVLKTVLPPDMTPELLASMDTPFLEYLLQVAADARRHNVPVNTENVHAIEAELRRRGVKGLRGKAERPSGWPVLVKALRDASIGIDVAAEQTGNEKVYFPPKAGGEPQPVMLRGYVSLKDLAGLVHYIADMLEP